MTSESGSGDIALAREGYRQAAWRLIPFLVFLFVLAWIDRVNVGFAKLQMLSDLKFSEAVYGFGAGIFFIGYFLFEVPSNLLLEKIGARRTLARITILWGLTSIAMAWVQSEWTFYLLRFLLGVFEAGFFPGVVLYLTYWFWIGVGSDHTDRKAEAAGIALSKQLCGKPVGTQLWRYEEVEPHWDWLMLRAYATIDGVRTLYQESEVASLRTPRDLIRKHTGASTLPVGTAMYCGTPAAIGGIRPATRFEMELEDPVLGRTLRHAYNVEVLPVVS